VLFGYKCNAINIYIVIYFNTNTLSRLSQLCKYVIYLLGCEPIACKYPQLTYASGEGLGSIRCEASE
jgi:hypothetical protein